jgi:long-chain acyl-CoA synthetase
MGAVPRVFEKIYARIIEKGSNSTGMKRKIFDWSLGVAKESWGWRAKESGASPFVKLKWAIADKLVYKKIREGTGGKLRIVLSGGAPLARELAEFFWAVGVPIFQGYGLTETSPVLTSNCPVNRNGSSGKAIPHVELRIADDGEILAKGPCVMQGYYKNAEATREVFTEDGWFKTGDIGHIDKDGYLFITDRKKDMIKTAGGKFVAPQPIENALKTSRYISNAMVVGDQRRFVVAIIVPNFSGISSKAAEERFSFNSNLEMAASPWTKALIQSEIDRLTVHLASYESIKRFALLPEDFTFDSGELTFTLKLKRRIVEQKFKEVIESLYADTSEPRPSLQD